MKTKHITMTGQQGFALRWAIEHKDAVYLGGDSAGLPVMATVSEEWAILPTGLPGLVTEPVNPKVKAYFHD